MTQSLPTYDGDPSKQDAVCMRRSGRECDNMKIVKTTLPNADERFECNVCGASYIQTYDGLDFPSESDHH